MVSTMRGRENMDNICKICYRPATDFNYGVQSCNACKMFFRRQVVRTVPLRPCPAMENCYDVPFGFHECPFCRFQKCISAGMNLQGLLRKTGFQDLIRSIETLNFNRNFLLSNAYPLDPNLTVTTVIQSEVQYAPTKSKLDYNTWLYSTTVTTIDFMRKFPFLYFSKIEDQEIIVKSCFVKIANFCAAFQAYSEGNDFLGFGDQDLLENRIRYRLVRKLVDLKIRKEEFLLVLVILFSNPATPNLSETSRLLLTAYRNLYTSALMDYCMSTYQKFGPTRFMDLLSISNVVAKNYDDLNQYYVLLQLSQPDFQLDFIVREGLDLL